MFTEEEASLTVQRYTPASSKSALGITYTAAFGASEMVTKSSPTAGAFCHTNSSVPALQDSGNAAASSVTSAPGTAGLGVMVRLYASAQDSGFTTTVRVAWAVLAELSSTLYVST